MSPKKRIGLQIRFNPESEKDLVDFFSTLKKSEVHITVISAFRMYMRQVGFYDSLRLENCYSPNVLKEKEGLEDEEAFRTLDGMFDNEYEKIFNTELNGFRLLFLTNTFPRMKKICDLVREMPPSDFIWISEQNRMFSHGVSAEIWTRGGRHQKPPESILGPKLAFKATVLDKIR